MGVIRESTEGGQEEEIRQSNNEEISKDKSSVKSETEMGKNEDGDDLDEGEDADMPVDPRSARAGEIKVEPKKKRKLEEMFPEVETSVDEIMRKSTFKTIMEQKMQRRGKMHGET